MFRSHQPRRQGSRAEFQGVEPLEARIAMSTVHWTGHGDGVTLNSRYNWECNSLPGLGDTAVINVAANPDIVLNSGSLRVKKLLLSENLKINGGTLEVGAGGTTVAGALTIAGGQFTGSGKLTTTGALNWTAGKLSGTGIVEVAASGRFTIAGTGALELRRDVLNRGRIDWTGGNIDGYDLCGTDIVNEAGATFKASGQGRFRSLCAPGLIDNRGLFVRDTTGSTQVLTAFRNSGTLNVAGGTLELWGGGVNSGARNVAQGAILHYFGNFTHLAGSTLAGGGSTIWQGGVHTIAADQAMDSYLYVSNATVTGPGMWTIDGVLGWSHGRLEGTGGTLIGESGKIEIRTFGQHTLARNIDNNGVLIWNRGELTLEGATITNRAERMFFVCAEATATAASGDNAIINQGEIRKVRPEALGFGGVRLDNAGLVYVRNGSLTLGQGAVAQLSEGTLSGGSWRVFGTGELSFSGDQIRTVGAGASITRIGRQTGLAAMDALERNEGSITVSGGGSLSLTPGTGEFVNAGRLSLSTATMVDIAGNFVQTSTGWLDITISGPATLLAGRMICASSATLAGTVAANLVEYTPLLGDHFLFLSAPSLQGQFDSAQFGVGLEGHLEYLQDGVLFMYE